MCGKQVQVQLVTVFSMFVLIELMLMLVYVIEIGMDDRGVYARCKCAD